MSDTIELKEINVEGDRAKPRNARRLIIEVMTDRIGVVVEGHALVGPLDKEGRPSKGGTPQKQLIEIYADRLPRVARRVRTAAHNQAMKEAQNMCDRMIVTWKKSGKVEKILRSMRHEEERNEWIRINCPYAPEHFYEQFGFRTGVPPLMHLTLVSQDRRRKLPLKKSHKDTPDRLSLEEWEKLPDGEADGFLRNPPKTGSNDMERAVAAMAAVIQRANPKA